MRAIGPRTVEHLDDLLAGVDVRLSDEILDRIDEIVAPGTDVGGRAKPPTCSGPASLQPPPPTRQRTRRRLTASRDTPTAAERELTGSQLPPRPAERSEASASPPGGAEVVASASAV